MQRQHLIGATEAEWNPPNQKESPAKGDVDVWIFLVACIVNPGSSGCKTSCKLILELTSLWFVQELMVMSGASGPKKCPRFLVPFPGDSASLLLEGLLPAKPCVA